MSKYKIYDSLGPDLNSDYDSLAKIYGNNLIELTNYKTSLLAVVNELPSVGMSTEWENAPISEVYDDLKKFACDDLIMGTAFLFGGGAQNQINIGRQTTQMFKGSNINDIELKFKIYTNNYLEGLTPAHDWIRQLTKYASIDAGAATSLATSLQNIKNALNGAKAAGGKFMKVIFDGDYEDEDESEDKKEEDQKKIIRAAKNIIFQHCHEIVNKVREKDLNGGKDNPKFDMKVVKDNDDDPEIEFDCTWSTRKESDSSDENIEFNLQEADGTIDIGDIADRLKDEDSDWKNDNVKNPEKTRNAIKRVLNELNRRIKNGGTNKEALEEKKKKINIVVDKVLKQVTAAGYGGDDRVINVTNLGASLWYLKIYPFVYKKPLIVAISNWSCTPSVEMIGGEHAYYDFSITCTFDQKPSVSTWKNIFYNILTTDETAANPGGNGKSESSQSSSESKAAAIGAAQGAK